ncbi:MAG: biotin transporter BioY [Planctomycetaceae bacterium]|nr:biotin transporter BioY [Planctomycetaceae bacterium]
MIFAGVWSEWATIRSDLFHWRKRLAIGRKLALCLGMACLTGLLAQVRVPLPFTPVPVTGQVVAVLLAGILLGRRFGAVSQVIYVGLGAVGVPWFSGWTSGSLFGPTAGYLLGFIAAAGLIGWLVDNHPSVRRLPWLLVLMSSGIGIIYLLGALQFAWVTRMDLTYTLKFAVLPFIPFDVAKAILAASVSSALLPKQKRCHRGGEAPR